MQRSHSVEIIYIHVYIHIYVYINTKCRFLMYCRLNFFDFSIIFSRKLFDYKYFFVILFIYKYFALYLEILLEILKS